MRGKAYTLAVMKYRLMGIDLDGTLLQPDRTVSRADLEAIQRAQEAGCVVVPATGRGWREAAGPLEPVEGLTLGVFNTGACVATVATGESIKLSCFEPHVVLELIEFLRPMPCAVLVYLDRHDSGYDYLVTGDGPVTENTQAWFDRAQLRVTENRHPTAEDLHHALRVGLVAEGDAAFTVEAEVVAQFGERIEVHAFAGVPVGEGATQVYIAEVFARGVNKWRGLSWIAAKHGIDASLVAAIGDEINDLAMLEHAGLGIAMRSGVERAKAAADVEAGSVAEAIDHMLCGRW